jgi:O-acetyl-ADP-ribose deacetylase
MQAADTMQFGRTKVLIKQGDITKEQVDAIVNATNPHLAPGAGVDAAIHRSGGPSIAAELKQIVAKIKQCPVGDAVITGAGKLKAQNVVHAVGPIWHGGKKGEAEDLETTYYNSLILAKEYGAKTVALCAISTGAYGYPIESAAEIALKTTKSFCEEHSCFDEVRFVLFTPEIFSVFQAKAALL